MSEIEENDVRAAFDRDYRIAWALGQGAHGRVFKAVQRETDLSVAIKVQRLSSDDVAGNARLREARFEREARLCEVLEHPRIVRLLDKGRRGDFLFLVFEFVPGQTLAQVLARERCLSPDRAVSLMAEVLEALIAAHSRGVVHRDIKPDNLMVVGEGDGEHVKVLDFGVAAFESGSSPASSPITGSLEILGTPCYAAPEQLRGEPGTACSDLYSWALVFLECLTGERVMQGATLGQVFQRQLSSIEVPLPPSLRGHALGEVLRLALRKNPRERAHDAARLLCELQAVRVSDLVGSLSSSESLQLARTVSLVGQARFEGEQRQCTALSVSIDVFAAGSRPADVELLHTVQQDQLNTCSDVAARFGGYLGGRLANRMIAVFGLPVASERDARRAAGAALELAPLLSSRSQALAARHGIELEWRIGIDSDIAIVDADGAPSGPALNVAARLESLAEACTVLVTARTHALLRRFYRMRAVDSGAVAVRAVSPAYTLVSDGASAAESWPTSTTELLGRDSELATLLAGWARACAGSGSIVLISGEPGVGKTRLVGELRARAARTGAAALYASCQPENANTALLPVLALIRDQLELAAESAAGPQRVQKAIDDAGGDGRLVGPILASWLGLGCPDQPPSSLSSERQRELLLDVLVELLGRAGHRGARLIVLEDVHWADPTTEELIARLAETVRDSRALVLLTARPEFELRAARVTRLDLGGLDEDSARSLAIATAGSAAPDAGLISLIVRRTDGVPLFIEELTRHLIERTEGETGAVAHEHVSVPHTLRELLTTRLDRLGEAKEIAQLASAIGREFELELLAAISPRNASALQEGIDALLAAGIVQRDAAAAELAYVFRHALIQQVAGESMLTARRHAAHGAIARHLQSRAGADPARIAWHFASADMPEEASRYRLIAGEQSARASAYREAIDHLRAGLDLVSRIQSRELASAREIELLNALGAVLIATQGFATDDVVYTFSRAEQLARSTACTGMQRFSTLRGLWTFHNARANYPAASGLCGELLALAAQQADPGLRISAHDCACQTALLRGRFLDCVQHGDACDQLFDAVSREEQVVRFGIDPWLTSLGFSCIADVLMGRLSRARLRLDRGLQALERLELPAAEATFLAQAAALEVVIGSCGPRPNSSLELCRARAARARELGAKYGLRFAEGYAALVHGMADAVTGDEAGVAALGAGVQLWQQLGLRAASSWHRAFLAVGYQIRGQYEAALDCALSAIADCASNGEAYGAAESERVLAYVLGDIESPLAEVARARIHYLRSLDIAAAQEARWLELRAAYTYAAQLPEAESLTRLRQALGWFVASGEGSDTALVRDSLRILAE